MKKNYIELLHRFIDLAPKNNIGTFQLGLMHFYHQDPKKGINIIKKVAHSYPYAYTFLGMAYLDGEIVKKDSSKAISYLKKGRQGGDSEALVQLSNLYLNNDILPIDLNKAIRLLNEAIKQNHSGAMFNLGVLYLGHKDLECNYQKAYHLFKRSSESGNINATTFIGLMYENGYYVQKNDIEAFKYYLKGTSGQSPIAHFFLGRFYEEGRLTKENLDEAVEHYEIASSYGHFEATHKLIDIYFDKQKKIYNPIYGKLYLHKLLSKKDSYAFYKYGKFLLNGKHYPQNTKEGLKYLRKSNTPEGFELLGMIYSTNTFANKNYQVSLNYFLKASTLGNTNAIYKAAEIIINNQINVDFISLIESAIKLGNDKIKYLYGKCYHYGWGVKIDLEYAYDLYKKSKSPQGYRAAGLCCLKGIGTERNIKRAIYYLNKSITNNDKVSPLILGKLYLFGEEIKNDIKKGIKFLTIAANRKSAEANYLLSTLFIEREIDKAMLFLKRAIQLGSNDAKILYKKIKEKGQ